MATYHFGGRKNSSSGKALNKNDTTVNLPLIESEEHGLIADFSQDNLLNFTTDFINKPKPPSETPNPRRTFDRNRIRKPKAEEIELDTDQFSPANQNDCEIKQSSIYGALLESEQAQKSLRQDPNSINKIKNKSYHIVKTMLEGKIIELNDRLFLENIIANNNAVKRHKIEKEINEKTLYTCSIILDSERIKVSLIEKEVMQIDDDIKIQKDRSNSLPNLTSRPNSRENPTNTTKRQNQSKSRVIKGAASVKNTKETIWDEAQIPSPPKEKPRGFGRPFSRRRNKSTSDINSTRNKMTGGKALNLNQDVEPLPTIESNKSSASVTDFHIRKILAAGPTPKERSTREV